MQNPTTRPQRPALEPIPDHRPLRPTLPIDSRIFGGWGVRF
jgi:hypothetical protein